MFKGNRKYYIVLTLIFIAVIVLQYLQPKPINWARTYLKKDKIPFGCYAISNKLKKLWLLGFVVLTIIMISVGGVTRLTKSGLSIVEWKPVWNLNLLAEAYEILLYGNRPSLKQSRLKKNARLA